ncbi:MAG: hypothetical protein WBP29_13600, partial [Candidatus Zixiibacteriota bacterium]
MKIKFMLAFGILAVSSLVMFQAQASGAAAKIVVDSRQLDRDSIKVWIFFADKGERINNLSKPKAISESARIRRAIRGSTVGASYLDREISSEYIEEIRPYVTRIVHHSRWLNAISAYVKPSKL